MRKSFFSFILAKKFAFSITNYKPLNSNILFPIYIVFCRFAFDPETVFSDGSACGSIFAETIACQLVGNALKRSTIRIWTVVVFGLFETWLTHANNFPPPSKYHGTDTLLDPSRMAATVASATSAGVQNPNDSSAVGLKWTKCTKVNECNKQPNRQRGWNELKPENRVNIIDDLFACVGKIWENGCGFDGQSIDANLLI